MEPRDFLRANDTSKWVRKSGRWVFSILVPLVAAVLLFVVLRAQIRGQQLPDFVIFIEALGFVVVIMAGTWGTWFLIRGMREHPGLEPTTLRLTPRCG